MFFFNTISCIIVIATKRNNNKHIITNKILRLREDITLLSSNEVSGLYLIFHFHILLLINQLDVLP